MPLSSLTSTFLVRLSDFSNILLSLLATSNLETCSTASSPSVLTCDLSFSSTFVISDNFSYDLSRDLIESSAPTFLVATNALDNSSLASTLGRKLFSVSLIVSVVVYSFSFEKEYETVTLSHCP